MKIFENLTDMPTRFGEAEVVFRELDDSAFQRSSSATPIAERKEKVIYLPNDEDAKLYAIKDSQQFLFTTDAGGTRQLFFGGMDESPFLVQLDYSLIEQLLHGEDAFFRGLKPQGVLNSEKLFGSEAKRQGDFFAVYSKKYPRWVDCFKNHLTKGSFQTSYVSEHSVRGTRHKFTGLLALSGTESNAIMIGEGVLEAPDHKPLVLKGPHLIAQASGLVKPKEAD